jgi:DNA mismatch repair ATPase MutS
MTERDKEWFYGPSRSILVGTQTFFFIERWKAEHQEALQCGLEAWGDFEALATLANYAYEHPDNQFPELQSGHPTFEAKGMHHPLLPPDGSVPNDIGLNTQNMFYVISGSNMSGKSTLLRAIGLNSVLAHAGAPVAAERMVLSRFTICASLRIQDSLSEGKSKFLAEIERLKQILTVPMSQRPVLYLIDEMLSGTNSIDRRKVAEAVVRACVQQNAIGAISTHDLALTELAHLPELHGMNAHMSSCDDSDPLSFDYILKPGPTTQSSALAIARLAGLSLSS